MTYSAADILGLLQTAHRRPLVVTGQVSPRKIDELLARVAQITPSAWRVGDGSEHSWDEHHLRGSELDRILDDLPLVERLADLATRVVGWINRFGEGSWIASHRDAGGDVQCIIPLELPGPRDGGTIWIGCPDLAVPMDVGDLLLFSASSLPHGTSSVIAGDRRRITINLRFWTGVVLNAPPK